MKKFQFKKEFDIDKDFFMEKPKPPSKRGIAVKVFLCVLFLTFAVLCYCAFSFNINSKFGSIIQSIDNGNLKDAQNYYFEAMKSYDEGNFDKAIELLNKQLTILDDPDAYNYLAKIYLEQNNTDLAIENYKKAIEFNPNFFEANFELGKIYYSMNDYKNASKYLTNASNLQVENVEALSLTAECYKMTGHADDAIIIFEKILEQEPNSAFASAKIGEIYYQRLDYKKAIPYLEDAIQLVNDENTAMQLAKAYYELNMLEASMSVADDILAVNKQNTQAQSLKKALQYKLGKIKQKPPIKEEVEKKPVEVIVDKNLLNQYIQEIELSIKTNWTPPVGSNLKKASVKFSVNKEGELVSNVIYSSSGLIDFDKSALDAIELSAPFPPLPDGLNKEVLDIIFTFDFNIQN